MHLQWLSQCAAPNLFILVQQASFHLWFDHLENGAKEKKKHEIDGWEGQGGIKLICLGRHSVTQNDQWKKSQHAAATTTAVKGI